jgi:ribosomal protein L37AE/L43A
MYIKTITSQNRRDFRAIYCCEHCGDEHKGSGYDDSLFHDKVIPTMACKVCGKTGDDTYVPRATKYPDGMVV